MIESLPPSRKPTKEGLDRFLKEARSGSAKQSRTSDDLKRGTWPSSLMGAQSSSIWPKGFVIFQILCQLALVSSFLAQGRVLARVAAFGANLIFLAILPGQARRHPACRPALLVLAIVGLSLVHPGTAYVAGAAQFAMYLAILAPLFWIARVRMDAASFRFVVFMIWAFHTLSATFGVLQVYFPGSFQPNLSSVILSHGQWYLRDLTITLANGQSILRPMGLTDIPGGAATAGFYSILLGLGLFFSTRRIEMKSLYLASMVAGLFCIYLSQVRTNLVVTAICVIVFAGVIMRRGDFSRFSAIAFLLTLIVIFSFYWATAIGGKSVTKRLATLTGGNVSELYYKSRGSCLEYSVNVLLPQYPLGGGLGRWGMMNYYFGGKSNPDNRFLWVEVQWTGWLVDGGIPLILAYASVLGIAWWMAWRIAMSSRSGHLEIWGSLICAYNLGAVAMTFSYPLFMAQGGMEFWFLNAALYAAALQARQSRIYS